MSRLEKQRLPWPFTLKIADRWTARYQENQIAYIPPIAPMGMDVYVMGHFSADDPAKQDAVFAEAQKFTSETFARYFKTVVSEQDFSWTQVAGERAMYFEAFAPRRPSAKWRQWAFVKNGWCILVVSLIDRENEAQLFPDVQRMIATLEVQK